MIKRERETSHLSDYLITREYGPPPPSPSPGHPRRPHPPPPTPSHASSPRLTIGQKKASSFIALFNQAHFLFRCKRHFPFPISHFPSSLVNRIESTKSEPTPLISTPDGNVYSPRLATRTQPVQEADLEGLETGSARPNRCEHGHVPVPVPMTTHPEAEMDARACKRQPVELPLEATQRIQQLGDAKRCPVARPSSLSLLSPSSELSLPLYISGRCPGVVGNMPGKTRVGVGGRPVSCWRGPSVTGTGTATAEGEGEGEGGEGGAEGSVGLDMVMARCCDGRFAAVGVLGVRRPRVPGVCITGAQIRRLGVLGARTGSLSTLSLSLPC